MVEQPKAGFEVIKKPSEDARVMTSEIPSVQEKHERLPILDPSNQWPPPLYIDQNAGSRELYYMEHRWYSQWKYYDGRASGAKQNYQRLQLIIGVGSVAVPVLVGIQFGDDNVRVALNIATVLISLLVAAAAAIENVMKYGDAWRSYRAATEELQREKSMYDTRSGPYRRSTNPFLLFVERCEDIMAKQNGSWAALKEDDSAKGENRVSDDVLATLKE
ncbi:MAG: hypothetical protein OHK0046_01990 [Anaerolineae bacterium]